MYKQCILLLFESPIEVMYKQYDLLWESNAV